MQLGESSGTLTQGTELAGSKGKERVKALERGRLSNPDMWFHGYNCGEDHTFKLKNVEDLDVWLQSP